MLRRGIPIVVIVVLTAIVYAQSLQNGFVEWDDGLLILNNAIVHGLSLGNVIRAFTSYDPELYIPLTFLSYQANYSLHGLEPFGYHLVNLLLHVGNALLVFAVLQLLTDRNRRTWLSAAFGAALFALHPLHTEAVVWASARKDVLSAFFFLLSVWMYLRSSAPRSRSAYWMSVAFFLLALLSKVSVLLWPLLMPLVDWYMGDHDSPVPQGGVPHASRRAADVLKHVMPFAILSLVFGIIALGGKIANAGFLWEKILIGSRAITLLLVKFLWPAGLSVLYPFTKPIALATPELAVSLGGVVALSLAVLWVALRRGWRAPLLAWAWFLVFLVPSMSNIAKGHNELLDVYVTSDRYAYLPSVGLILIAAVLVSEALQHYRRTTVGVCAALVLVLGILSYRQSLLWHDTLTLFTHVAEVQPNAYVAWSAIGTEETRRGNVVAALDAYGKALAIRDDATTWYNVGQILRAQGKIDLAIQAYRKAIESSPLEVDAKRALEELAVSSEQ